MTRTSGSPNLEKADFSKATILDELVENGSKTSKYREK